MPSDGRSLSRSEDTRSPRYLSATTISSRPAPVRTSTSPRTRNGPEWSDRRCATRGACRRRWVQCGAGRVALHLQGDRYLRAVQHVLVSVPATGRGRGPRCSRLPALRRSSSRGLLRSGLFAVAFLAVAFFAVTVHSRSAPALARLADYILQARFGQEAVHMHAMAPVSRGGYGRP
jgi:hypothetical protein